jgi:hypothetical protein
LAGQFALAALIDENLERFGVLAAMAMVRQIASGVNFAGAPRRRQMLPF